MTDSATGDVSYQPVEHHPPVEEYLQAIESLNEEGTPAIQARIASGSDDRRRPSRRCWSDSRPTATSSGPEDHHLTEQGQDVAQTVLRKHRLAERLLVDVIGLPWHLVHDEAGRWEHVMSDEVMARLVEILGDPATCPHGNPIPGSANRPENPSPQVPLAESSRARGCGSSGSVKRSSSNGATLRYLDEAGFIPVHGDGDQQGPGRDALLEADGTTLVLGADLCQRMYVVVL